MEYISGTDPDPSHTYAEVSTYQAEITGTFPRIFLDAHELGEGDVETAARLRSIDQWRVEWASMHRAFAGPEKMTIAAPGALDKKGRPMGRSGS